MTDPDLGNSHAALATRFAALEPPARWLASVAELSPRAWLRAAALLAWRLLPVWEDRLQEDFLPRATLCAVAAYLKEPNSDHHEKAVGAGWACRALAGPPPQLLFAQRVLDEVGAEDATEVLSPDEMAGLRRESELAEARLLARACAEIASAVNGVAYGGSTEPEVNDLLERLMQTRSELLAASREELAAWAQGGADPLADWTTPTAPAVELAFDLGVSVSEDELAELERAFRATGAPDDEAAWLRARVRRGELDLARLQLAAYCGHGPSRVLLRNLPPDIEHPTRWLGGLEEHETRLSSTVSRALLAGLELLAAAPGLSSLGAERASACAEAIEALRRCARAPSDVETHQTAQAAVRDVFSLFRGLPYELRFYLRSELPVLCAQARVSQADLHARIEEALIAWTLGGDRHEP